MSLEDGKNDILHHVELASFDLFVRRLTGCPTTRFSHTGSNYCWDPVCFIQVCEKCAIESRTMEIGGELVTGRWCAAHARERSGDDPG